MMALPRTQNTSYSIREFVYLKFFDLRILIGAT